jgi:hypothetical protein
MASREKPERRLKAGAQVLLESVQSGGRNYFFAGTQSFAPAGQSVDACCIDVSSTIVGGGVAVSGVLIATTCSAGMLVVCMSWKSQACPADVKSTSAALAARLVRSFCIDASVQERETPSYKPTRLTSGCNPENVQKR